MGQKKKLPNWRGMGSFFFKVYMVDFSITSVSSFVSETHKSSDFINLLINQRKPETFLLSSVKWQSKCSRNPCGFQTETRGSHLSGYLIFKQINRCLFIQFSYRYKTCKTAAQKRYKKCTYDIKRCNAYQRRFHSKCWHVGSIK